MSHMALNRLTVKQRATFDAAAKRVHAALGSSYDNVAAACERAAGKRLTSVTARRWLVSRSLSPRMAFVICKAAAEMYKLEHGKHKDIASVEEFHPWISEFIS